jgi:hypothetical protein
MPNELWPVGIWREHRGGTLTRAYRDVMLTLRTYRGRGALICSAHETRADGARCSVRTVQRASRQAKRLDLVAWSERRVRAGWRWLHTSNRHEPTVPDGPVQPELRPVWSRSLTRQAGRGGESGEKKRLNRGIRLGWRHWCERQQAHRTCWRCSSGQSRWHC